ncbi:lipopolysaccharide biosynthesis protein [Arvimicrobium flavum]|uniref:lipopolysaccharide biosynthesis protein n=1 Tax=Arvimicrobium flavum TaxID=3393320 RepID=UPI00237A227C|nr:lipopolysaccharide biosynthesis protein [Mesorhizobium shangrilense]
MTDLADSAPVSRTAKLRRLLTARRNLLRGYLSAVSGSAGRLVFSLVYFVALANSLSIPDFGLFATASAAGVMLSRILAFGFISPLYRAASVKPRLIGVFTGGFLLMSALSLPALALASFGTYLLFFSPELSLPVFLTVIAAEALLWRPFEAVVIVNNGLGLFGRGALLVIMGTAFRAAAAGVFAFWPHHDLGSWSLLYLAANAGALLIGAALCYPRQRIRFRPALYWRRLHDAVTVAGSEVLFYLQSEFDKLIVLALGGPALAGIYAIVMRLVDLTAIPIRAFSMMLVQKMMRTPEMLRGLRARAGIEAAIFAVSTAALAAMAVVLHFFPTALGRNVAEAAPLVGLAIFVPGLRNLIEYQAELLYARGQTLLRVVSLAMLAALKALILFVLIRAASTPDGLIWSLNAGFLGLYLASAAFTYAALTRPARTF